MTEMFTEELLKEVWNDAMQKQAEPYVMHERAAIVAFMRSTPYSVYEDEKLKQVEAGEHLK